MPENQYSGAVTNQDDAPVYVKAFSILALITAIISFLVPVFGVLLLVPIAILFGVIALFGGDYKNLCLWTIIIVAVNLVVSPTFWVNVGVSGQPGGAVNMVLSYFNIIGVILMIVLFARKKRSYG